MPQDYVIRTLATANVNDGVFSADHRQIITSGSDGYVRVYDVATGAQVSAWRIGGSTGGPLGAVTIVEGLPAGSPRYAVVNAEGGVGGVGTLYRINLDTGQITAHRLPAGTTTGAFTDIEGMANGQVMITMSADSWSGGQGYWTFNALTGQFTAATPLGDAAFYSSNNILTEDGRYVLFAETQTSGAEAGIFDAVEGRMISSGSLQFGSFNFGITALSGASRTIASFEYYGTINLLDFNFQPIRSIQVGERVFGLAFSADGRTLYYHVDGGYSGLPDQLVIMDVATGTIIERIDVDVPDADNRSLGNTLLVSPDGSTISIMGTESVRLIDLSQRDQSFVGTTGVDRMAGGNGNDRYVVNAVGDAVVEGRFRGHDTVTSSIDSYTLAANVEDLVLTGAARVGNGNALANVITGTTAANRLTGAGGDDRLSGAAGADYLNGGSGNDWLDGGGDNDELNGSTGDDELFGRAGDDVLNGGDGNDVLDGGGGVDRLVGGNGDDVYLNPEAIDIITEGATGGTADEVRTRSGSWTLAANLEVLTYTGTGAFRGTGNASANVITGGIGNDTLDGRGGADRLVGGLGDDSYVLDDAGDVVEETADGGHDTVRTSVNDSRLAAFVEDLVLTGTARVGTGNTLDNRITGTAGADTLFGLEGADTLIGGAGNDTLDGGFGADRLDGGAGDDLYRIDDAGDVIVESALASGGVDTAVLLNGLVLPGGYVMADGLENLRVEGWSGWTITGNAAANDIRGGIGRDIIRGGDGNDTLMGNSGDDLLEGGAGNDVLIGGLETDRMTGGAGADRFVFGNGDQIVQGDVILVDWINDFNRAQGDRIDLSAIDNRSAPGDQAFTFIGTAAFSGRAGELQFVTDGVNGRILGDIDGDGLFDVAVNIMGVTSMTAADFIL